MDEAVRALYPQSDKKHNTERNGDGKTSRGPFDSDKRKDRSGGKEKGSGKKRRR